MVTNEIPGSIHKRRWTSGLRSTVGWSRREAELTLRMIADNVMVAVAPPILFAVAAGIHYRLPAGALWAGVGKAAVLGLLTIYLIDSSNQVHAGTEDAHNKPYRPIPAGLATSVGLAHRFWFAMPIYLLLGWAFGAWPWVVLWQVALVAAYRWGTARRYLWWKPFFNISGAASTLAVGWQVAAPLDRTAWTWIATVALYFPLALTYEDVRDMEGDRAVGRRTPALIFGPTFVRCWFAALMAFLPFMFYFALARTSGAGDWRGVASAAVLGLLSWVCAARALLRHGRSADRLTLQVFYVVWALTLGTAPLLLS
jgi:4-hydroxybenzoate polyprenyltransferase